MKGLLTKEFIYITKTGKAFLLLGAGFGIGGALTGNIVFVLLFPMLSSLLVISQSGADEQSKWERLVIALPNDRKEIVAAKYLMTCIITLLSIAFVALCYMITVIGGSAFSSKEFGVLVTSALIMGMLYPAIMIPLNYKFQSQTVRLIARGIFGACIGFSVAAINENTFEKMLVLVSKCSSMMHVIVLAAVAVLFAVSWVISVSVYKKRDV